MNKQGSKNKPSSRKHGRSQSGLRDYNERVILNFVRQKGAVPKAVIANTTGLSPQAVTVIINKLEKEGMLLRNEPVRGKVGQPTIPFSINPSGAYAYGMKIGRRSFDLTLIDLLGNVVGSMSSSCSYPNVDQAINFLRSGLTGLVPATNGEAPPKVLGLGIAMPFELWNWADELGAPTKEMQRWENFDIRDAIREFTDLPVYLCNDDTAACSAELMFGNPKLHRDFLYFYIGTFVGGGVVLDDKLVTGGRGNGGAVGSLPIPTINDQGQLATEQLILHASIRELEKLIGENESALDFDTIDHEILQAWLTRLCSALAYATVCSISIFDFETIIVDGDLPANIKQSIVKQTKEKIRQQDFRGLLPVNVVAGQVGSKAQSIGSATLPLLAEFKPDSQQIFEPQSK